jgi:hypothetical protein
MFGSAGFRKSMPAENLDRALVFFSKAYKKRSMYNCPAFEDFLAELRESAPLRR